MKILCVLGEHNYGDPARGECYEYVNFLPAMRNLGHQVIFFESFNRDTYHDFADLNRKFLEKVQTEKPDIILCVLLGYEIWLETLELVREGSNTIIINWSTDDSWKYEQFSRYVAPAFHHYATTYPEAIAKSKRNGHKNFVLTQWASNSNALAIPLPANKCKYGVSFVGSAYGNRARWIAKLRERGIDVACFGYGWPSGPVDAEEIPRIIRNSVVSLNFGDSGLHLGKYGLYRSRQIKARVFEVPGAGGCLLTEYAPHISDYYALGKEIAIFDGVDDLADKINILLSDQDKRNAIALAGHERTARDHTYEQRFSHLFDTAIKKQELVKSLPVPDWRFDRERISQLQAIHTTGKVIRVFKQVLVWFFSLLFGPRRGARAARRLVYEISWRACGKRTFSASGLPGRMFYKES